VALNKRRLGKKLSSDIYSFLVEKYRNSYWFCNTDSSSFENH
jgi:hypothetical protein